jgi:hypothetical protein
VTGLTAYGQLGKFTWRMCATVLGAQSVLVFFGALVARGLADAQGQQAASTYLVVGSGLAALSLLAAAMMRRPLGVTLGWLVQLATVASAAVVPAMLVVGVIFGALWVTSLVQGHRIDTIQDRRALPE